MPIKHGYCTRQCVHPIYHSWNAMNKRCRDSKNVGWKWYGGRGISVCKKWLEFTGFLEDMSEGWAPGLTLDRKDNKKGYYLNNCRWATRRAQALNRSDNRVIKIFGKSKTITQWSKELGGDETLVTNRLKSGWSLDDAVSIKPGTVYHPRKKRK